MSILGTRNRGKIYGSGDTEVRALDGVNLSVDSGEFVAIVGTSGSGKSTLLHMLGGLDRPTSGSVIVDGKDIFSLKDEALTIFRRRKIGFVFQSYYLMPKMEAVDNVALPLLYADVPLKERRERAEEGLKMVGLEDRIHFLPNQMSGGQCQRVAIARAIVTNPALLLADEPTGALDSKSGKQVMEIFDSLSAKGMTILMITHDSDVAKWAKKTYHILDGELFTTLEEGGASHEA